MSREVDALERIAAALETIANRGRFVPPRHDYAIGANEILHPGDPHTFRLRPRDIPDRLEAVYISEWVLVKSVEAPTARAVFAENLAVDKGGIGLLVRAMLWGGELAFHDVTNREAVPRRVAVTAFFSKEPQGEVLAKPWK